LNNTNDINKTDSQNILLYENQKSKRPTNLAKLPTEKVSEAYDSPRVSIVSTAQKMLSSNLSENSHCQFFSIFSKHWSACNNTDRKNSKIDIPGASFLHVKEKWSDTMEKK
jgi:hypothetical protein